MYIYIYIHKLSIFLKVTVVINHKKKTGLLGYSMTGTSPLAWRRNHAGWCAGLALTPGETWPANGDTGEFSEFNRGRSGAQKDCWLVIDGKWDRIHDSSGELRMIQRSNEDLSKDTTCDYGDVRTNPHLWRSRRKKNQETNIKIIPCVFAQKSLGLVWKSGITMYNPQIPILSSNYDF